MPCKLESGNQNEYTEVKAGSRRNEVAMSSLFSGLERFGLTGMKDTEIYEKEEEKTVEKSVEPKAPHFPEESEMIFDKTYRCPVCDRQFKSKAVMSGKAKLVSIDTDLRPKYQGIDCIKYDVVVCDKCGYSALTRFFNSVTSQQRKAVQENISSNFKAIEYEDEKIYSYDEAVLRYQLALANAVIKKGRISERAYTCLKIAWLYRGEAENLDMSEVDYDTKLAELRDLEKEFITSAYDGFVSAMSKELFPICGMDEYTYTYVTADLARRCKDYETSAKLLSQIITSRGASSKVKERAREVRDLIKQELMR